MVREGELSKQWSRYLKWLCLSVGASSRVFRQSCWHGCHHRVSDENSLSSTFSPRHRTAKWIRTYIFIQYFKTINSSIVGYILWNSKHRLLGKMASTNINRTDSRISQWAAENDKWLLQLMWSCKFIVTHFHFHVNQFIYIYIIYIIKEQRYTLKISTCTINCNTHKYSPIFTPWTCLNFFQNCT